jgi:uncharacterized protein YegP (UPF0339 family)
MRNVFKLIIPLAAVCLAVGLADSSAQQPSKSKSKTPDVVDKSTPTAGLVFEVYQDAGGSYRYRIKDGEHNIGMASKGYDTKEEVRKIIQSIQNGAARAKVVEAPKTPESKSK